MRRERESCHYSANKGDSTNGDILMKIIKLGNEQVEAYANFPPHKGIPLGFIGEE